MSGPPPNPNYNPNYPPAYTNTGYQQQVQFNINNLIRIIRIISPHLEWLCLDICVRV